MHGCVALATFRDMQKLVMFVLCVVAAYLSFMSTAFAQNTISNVICSVYGLIYYDIGRGLATLAIAALSIGAMLGRVTWGQAVTVCAGMGLIFGAIPLAFAIMPLSLMGAVNGLVCGVNSSLSQINSIYGMVSGIFSNPLR